MAEHPNSWGEFLVREMEGRAKRRPPQQRIVIGICTRQRNALLRRLIDSIMAQPVPVAYQVELLVVDNNDSPSAADAISGLSGPFPITIVHEARAGLVHARNRALDEAVARDADWFIGLDDDEWVAADWLERFTSGLQPTAHPVLVAPCRYVYDAEISPFVKPNQIPIRPLGEAPAVLATSNFAIHRCVFDPAHGPGLRFDMMFNASGGEDLEFFLRAKRVFGWAPASFPTAIAHEDWNGMRGTLGYRLSRAKWCQLNEYRVARRHRQLGIFGSRKRNTARMLLRMNRQMFFGLSSLAMGVVHLPFRPEKGRHLIGYAMERGARIMAIFPFILGLIPMAYGPRAKAKDQGFDTAQARLGHAISEGR